MAETLWIGGSESVTHKFHNVVGLLEIASAQEDVDRMLQFEVLRLRLCRWRDAVAQMQLRVDYADTKLASIEALLTASPPRPSKGISRTATTVTRLSSQAKSTIPSQPTHWLKDVLQSRYMSDQGADPKKTPFAGQLDREKAVKNLGTISNNVESMEAEHLLRELDKLRLRDADAVTKHRQACEADIELLKKNSIQIDPHFSAMLSRTTHQFHFTRIDGRSVATMGDVTSSHFPVTAQTYGHSYRHTDIDGNAIAVMGNVRGYSPYPFSNNTPEPQSTAISQNAAIPQSTTTPQGNAIPQSNAVPQDGGISQNNAVPHSSGVTQRKRLSQCVSQ